MEMTDNPDGAFIKAITPVDGKVALRLNHPEVVVNHLIKLYGLESDTLKPVEIDKDKIQLISEKNKYEVQNKRNERLNQYQQDNETLSKQEINDNDIETFLELRKDDSAKIDSDENLTKQFIAKFKYERDLDETSSNLDLMMKAADFVLKRQEAAKPEGLKPRGTPVSSKSSTAGEPIKSSGGQGFGNKIDEIEFYKKMASGA